MTTMSLSTPDTSWDPSSAVERASSGDQEAWAELVSRYTPRLYALAKSRLRSHHDAEEITQSVLVTVADKIASGVYKDQGRFEPWLFRIAMNRVRDEARRRSVHVSPTDPSDIPPTAVEDRAHEPERYDALRAAVEALPDDDRRIIELRHSAGLPFRTISELLGAPMGTLLARHHRALKKLRTALESSHTNVGSNQ